MKEEERKKISRLIKNEKWLELATICYGRADECLDYAKEKGWLKTSNGDYSSGKAIKVLSCFVGLSGIVDPEHLEKNIARGVNKKNKKFIHSLIILLQLSEKIKVKDQLLINNSEICNYSNIVLINKGFNENKDHIEAYAEQASYIFNAQKKIIKPYNTNIVPETDVFSIAKEILFYRDIEELVHNFSVNLEKNGDQIILKDDEAWIASLSYGFLRLDIQRQAKIKRYDDPSKRFIIDCVKKIIESNDLNRYIKRQDNFFELNISSFLKNKNASRDLKCFVESQEYYRDELLIIGELYGDLQISTDKLKQKFINESISIMDLLQFHRLSCFLNGLISKSDEPQLCFRIKQSDLKDFINDIFGSVFVSILDLLTQNVDGYTDFQYTPFLTDGLYYIIPTAILCNSNIIQNTMRFLENKARFDDHSNEDLIAAKYKSFFDKRHIPYCTGVDYYTSFSEHHGELDIVYQIDDEIYISENKNMLPPTCNHHAINCVKYFEKANEQKRIFMHYLVKKDSVLMKGLEKLKEKGIDFEKAKKVHFYLTFGNRFILCKNTIKFPVVYISEIITMMKNFPIIRHFGDNEEKIYWRDHQRLYANDMNQYLYSNRLRNDCKLIDRIQLLCGYSIISKQYQGYRFVWIRDPTKN